MQRKLTWAALFLYVFAGCVADPTDKWTTPRAKMVATDRIYKEDVTSVAAGALLKTGTSEFQVYDVIATDTSSGKPERRAYKVLVGPNTDANIGADGTVNVIGGWIYVWGKWPRARTERVTACAKGSSFGVYVDSGVTHVLYVSGTNGTDVEKFGPSGGSLGTRNLNYPVVPYVAITHDALPIELPTSVPTISTGVGVFIDDVNAMGPIFAGTD